jgi:hypothetical protein
VSSNDEKKLIVPLEAIENYTDIETQVTTGHRIMDVLQSFGIKEARFTNGAYFTCDKKKRVIAGEGVMIAETATDTIIRFPNENVSIDEIIKAEEFKPTQKMMAAYTGKSQSTVSKKRNEES